MSYLLKDTGLETSLPPFIEHDTHNVGVGGSSPPVANPIKSISRHNCRCLDKRNPAGLGQGLEGQGIEFSGVSETVPSTSKLQYSPSSFNNYLTLLSGRVG